MISLFTLKEENSIQTKGYTVMIPSKSSITFNVMVYTFLLIAPSYSSVPETRKDNQVNPAVITNSTKDNADAYPKLYFTKASS